MKTLLLLSTAIILSAMTFSQTIYDYKTLTLEGKEFLLSQLKGKKVMIVNTASKCGFTPQYKELEDLYKKYSGDNFIIVGFPSNDFMWQEPGTNSEIREFCTRNYGVTFPMMSKISVTGDKMDPIYKWLTSKSLNGSMDSKVKWNFQKYLIDENGKLIRVLPSSTKPMSEEVVNWIMGK